MLAPKARVLPLHYVLYMAQEVGFEPTDDIAAVFRFLGGRHKPDSATSAYGTPEKIRTPTSQGS